MQGRVPIVPSGQTKGLLSSNLQCATTSSWALQSWALSQSRHHSPHASVERTLFSNALLHQGMCVLASDQRQPIYRCKSSFKIDQGQSSGVLQSVDSILPLPMLALRENNLYKIFLETYDLPLCSLHSIAAYSLIQWISKLALNFREKRKIGLVRDNNHLARVGVITSAVLRLTTQRRETIGHL